ncbi:MAG TPA: 3-dehydroquinate synthase [Candidatus Acidoferrales bacterium]
MPPIRVPSATGPYTVYCESGALGRCGAAISALPDVTGVFILSSPTVWSHWGRAVMRSLSRHKPLKVILFDDRESSKDLQAIEAITRQLVLAGADRRSVIVAVGGGVVGDVAGFAAATYLRGVRFIHVPTTLVAQVDSSVGGKTGVNLVEGKNLVGAFYSPKVVVTDPAMLLTLPHREYRSGLYEVIKYGLIADPELFSLLERRMLALLRRDSKALAWVISRCIRIKAQVVAKDEREGGLREILNYGHTLGHALESATRYRRFRHGEAIAWGMIAAALFGVATNRFQEADATRLIRLVASVGPLPKIAGVSSAELKSILAGDKKTRGGRIRWVLPRRIGKVEWGVELPWALVSRTFSALPDFGPGAK